MTRKITSQTEEISKLNVKTDDKASIDETVETVNLS